MDEDVTRGFIEAGAVAVGAADKVGFVNFVELAIVVNFGFGDGVVGGGIDSGATGGDVPISTASLAPTAWAVEGKVAGVRFLEGSSGGRRNASGGEGDYFFVRSQKAAGAFADSEGFS